MKHAKIAVAVLLGSLLTTAPAFAAFEGLSMMRMGAWEVDFSGNVNAFVTDTECNSDANGAVGGGLACGSSPTDDGRDFHNIRTGLLPSWFNMSAATLTDEGIKTGIHISFQPGADSNTALSVGGNDGALGLNSANFRQVFLTFGNENMGTFKIGRDLGVYGSDAILNDMTLLGVGSGAGNGGGNTTLGRIGVGYLYADWKSQLQYTSPNINGFTLTAALVDTWGTGSFAGAAGNNGTPNDATDDIPHSATGNQAGDNFGFEAKVNYAFDNGAGTSGLLWASYIQQDVDFDQALSGRNADGRATMTSPAFAGDDGGDARGYDVGFKVAVHDFDLVGYYYDGEGIGTTSFLLDAFDPVGDERDADGFYVQARYRMPMGTLLGVSVGESNLDETTYDEARRANNTNGGGTLVETNESWIVGLYHPVGEALNLVIEYTDTESEAHNGNEADDESLAIGAIMFF